MPEAANESSLSLVSNQGLTATISSAAAGPDAAPSEKETRSNAAANGGELDFIGTGDAVKSLFSIPYHSSDQPLCLAVHNLGGTLLIDQTASLDETEDNYGAAQTKERGEGETQQSTSPSRSSSLPPSSQSLALALSPSVENGNDENAKAKSASQAEALALLSKMIKENAATGSESSARDILNAVKPLPPVREYLEWNFQDMKLLVGSDALVLRPEPELQTNATTIAVRVENVHRLNQLVRQADIIHQQRRQSSDRKEALSYAQALAKPREEQKQDHAESKHAPLNLDQVRLQTCIVPSSGPLGALLGNSSSSTLNPVESNADTATSQLQQTATDDGSPLCIVLDAYLDNVMANVPQLALCLEEKGVIQSVKLLQTDQIPSMMMHPSTLDTTKPIDVPRASDDVEELFSPKVMELNATALLRFLKQNCTRDNATYLLRREPGDTPNNIQLYDISSISSQRQKKWIWWLATMSYRFALRLRQCQAAVPHQRRSFRDRQRSLYQTTLDLLQDLFDMDGNAHESLVASVREHMAETFLGDEDLLETNKTEEESKTPPPVMTSSPPKHGDSFLTTQQTPSLQPQQAGTQQPYAKVTIDSLNKAHDHLVHAIKTLWPVLESHLGEPEHATSRRRKRGRGIGKGEGSVEPPPTAIAMQLFGLNYKVVNVSLRLAEHHLRNYYSSSAMQALRNSARRMADSTSLLDFMETNQREWIERLQLQYTWLWEHCGHFARSFASDELWRDRGHASGDDVIYVLRDVEAAFEKSCHVGDFEDPLSKKTDGLISLHSLSGIVRPNMMEDVPAMKSVAAAKKILSDERLLQRDKRQVLVASCISYSRAILTFQDMVGGETPPPQAQRGRANSLSSKPEPASGPTILSLLRQRLGDACNETGKVLLAALRTLLSNNETDEETKLAAEALLDSAQFWFSEGLDVFDTCHDVRNLALLRCNLCQCCKLRANSCFTSQASEGASHAEICLQEAAKHLQAAHEVMAERDADPTTWDMVSEELAATFLVLGVRRRQNLLGGGNAPVIFQAMRLSPGKERSITEPMEQALKIYEQSRNLHQAAAVHYQLALTNSKTWTCQRDETKTREKLSAAFTHYNMAFAYFSNNLRGNEPTFVLLCLDLASLYAAVSGEECLVKALSCCLDTYDAFSAEAIDAARSNPDWLDKMDTLASSVDDRVFKLMRSLVKLEADRYTDLYREALTAKMVNNVPEKEESNEKIMSLMSLHDVLVAVRKKQNA